MSSLEGAAATDRGRVRSTNQDLALVEQDLVAVADGMGGHAGGEVAAAIAVGALSEAFAGDRSTDGLIAAADQANRAIFERSEAEQNLHGMGTTLTAAALISDARGEYLAIVNVGDSRAYLFIDGQLSRLTEDHSLVEEMRRRGEITSAEAAVHPHRHILTRALGIDPAVEVDSWILEAVPGSRLLLCSDGLTNECDEAEIAQVLTETRDPAEAARVLVARALDHGGNDNITVVVADIVGTIRATIAPEATVAVAEPAEPEMDEGEPEHDDEAAVAAASAAAAASLPEAPTVPAAAAATTEALPVASRSAPVPRPPRKPRQRREPRPPRQPRPRGNGHRP